MSPRRLTRPTSMMPLVICSLICSCVNPATVFASKFFASGYGTSLYSGMCLPHPRPDSTEKVSRVAGETHDIDCISRSCSLPHSKAPPVFSFISADQMNVRMRPVVMHDANKRRIRGISTHPFFSHSHQRRKHSPALFDIGGILGRNNNMTISSAFSNSSAQIFCICGRLQRHGTTSAPHVTSSRLWSAYFI